MVSCNDFPGGRRMPGLSDLTADSGGTILAAYMRSELSNSCASRPAL